MDCFGKEFLGGERMKEPLKGKVLPDKYVPVGTKESDYIGWVRAVKVDDVKSAVEYLRERGRNASYPACSCISKKCNCERSILMVDFELLLELAFPGLFETKSKVKGEESD